MKAKLNAINLLFVIYPKILNFLTNFHFNQNKEKEIIASVIPTQILTFFYLFIHFDHSKIIYLFINFDHSEMFT